jgi:protein-S-isoprenylcysteine O-methyltransferase Ste14
MKAQWAAVLVSAVLLALGRVVIQADPNWADFALGWATGALGTVLMGALAVLWILGIPKASGGEPR